MKTLQTNSLGEASLTDLLESREKPLRKNVKAMTKPEHRKSYAHQRETTGSSNDSLQLHPFSKWKLLLKERICSKRERILSFMSSSL